MAQDFKAADQEIAKILNTLQRRIRMEEEVINENAIIKQRAKREGMPHETYEDADRAMWNAYERQSKLRIAKEKLEGYFAAIS